MNKKFKYTSLVAAGAVTLGLVGGTFAWFTSSHKVVNEFSTLGGTNGAGIEIVEDFDQNAANQVTPGSEVNKDVQVKNTEKYDQFIRVKLTPQFVKLVVEGENQKREPYTNDELGNLGIDNKMIELVLTNVSSTLEDNTWVDGGDGYYYYIAKVGEDSLTNQLLDAVVLSSNANRNYLGKLFDVVVDAESVQASNGAVVDQWFTAKEGQTLTELQEKLKEKYVALQSVEAGEETPEQDQ